MKTLTSLFSLVALSLSAQVPSVDFGSYTLEEVKGTSTVWASHVPGDDIEAGKITPYIGKIKGERASLPAFSIPKNLSDGIGKKQKNTLTFRRNPDGDYEGVLKYGDNVVPVIVVNGSYTMSFIEASDDAQTIYTVHRNVKNPDGSYLVTVSAVKNTALYVCTWSFAGKAILEKK